MNNNERKTIEQWKKDFPQYENLIVGTKLSDYALEDEFLPDNFYLPEGLTEIGSNALSEAVFNNDDFDLPSTLQKICEEAFSNAELDCQSNWTIPGGVKVLPGDCFAQIEYVGPALKFSEGLEEICTGAFADTILNVKDAIFLPKSLKTIQEGAFDGTTYYFEDKSYEVPDSNDVEFLRKWFINPRQNK